MYGNLARAYAQAGDKKLAATNFKKAIALLPNDEEGTSYLGLSAKFILAN